MSFTSSQSAAWRSACSTSASAIATASRRSGAGRRARCRGSTSSGTGSASGRPCRRAGARAPDRRSRRRCRRRRGGPRPRRARPGTTSCMRFRQRMKVDLPQPDGPMIAVTCVSGRSSVIALQRLRLAEPGAQSLRRASWPGLRLGCSRIAAESLAGLACGPASAAAGRSACSSRHPGRRDEVSSARRRSGRGPCATSTSAAAHACRCQSS